MLVFVTTALILVFRALMSEDEAQLCKSRNTETYRFSSTDWAFRRNHRLEVKRSIRGGCVCALYTLNALDALATIRRVIIISDIL